MKKSGYKPHDERGPQAQGNYETGVAYEYPGESLITRATPRMICEVSRKKPENKG
ncbi:MAG: hypothetical protein ACREA9_17540 [Pyrinomonadaceae bacterium]